MCERWVDVICGILFLCFRDWNIFMIPAQIVASCFMLPQFLDRVKINFGLNSMKSSQWKKQSIVYPTIVQERREKNL